ncbi:hypothetical protein KW787_03270 [Candidatus Pacearchaeota archaeon]|nr:hypothetical protein [Candidatus Pacearchaeota archaeon]
MVGNFDYQGRKPLYEDKELGIVFVNNSNDGPHAYDVFIKDKDHLYIPERTLEDLTDTGIPTERMMKSFDNMSNGMATHLLFMNNISQQDFHASLRRLRDADRQQYL